MTDVTPFKYWFDKKTGEFRHQGTMPDSFKSNMLTLIPKIEKIIEEEVSRKALNRSRAAEKPVKSKRKGSKKKSAAHEFPISDLSKTDVTQGWVPQGEYVEVAGRKIPGMIYICDSREMGAVEKKKCAKTKTCIDVALPVSGHDKKGNKLNSSNYSEMEPANRASYLDWLANGKKDTDFHQLYAYVYLFGLEHRLLLGEITHLESQEIRKELGRLKAVFADYHDIKIQTCINDLLFFEKLTLHSETAETEELAVFFNLPINLQLEISDAIFEGRGLTGTQIFEWYFHSTRFRSYNLEFLLAHRDEFLEEFSKFFPDGMKVEPTADVLKMKYVAISREFKLSEPIKANGRTVADIDKLEFPLVRAEAIMKRIRNGSTVPMEGSSEQDVQSSESANNTDNAQVRPPQNSAKALEFIEWANEMAKIQTPATWGELLGKLEGERPRRIDYADWHFISGKITGLGFDSAPHEMFITGDLSLDDQLFLFELKEAYTTDTNGNCFLEEFLALLGFGSFLMSSMRLDAKDTKEMLWMLVSDSETLNTKCNQSDLAAIQANIDYLLLKPVDYRFIKKLHRCSRIVHENKHRPLIVSAARKLDISHAKTVAAVEKIYKLFKLDTKFAYSDLHSGEFVHKKTDESAKTGKESMLDEARIESIRTDTEKVSNVLGEIFTEDRAQEADVAKNSKTSGKSTANARKNGNGSSLECSDENNGSGSNFPGLDDKHAGLLGKLVRKSYWSEKAFAKLAEEHGLMPGGVTETINEWVHERYDDILIDEHQGFHLTAAIAEVMKSKIGTKRGVSA